MPVPVNTVKAALAAGKRQTGLWIAMAHATSAEIAGKAGFDFCLIDGEHSPNDIPIILDQVRAISLGSAQPAVRVPVFDPRLIKQVLDIGVQTIIVPMIDTAEQAAEVVASTRYAPAGFRGVGAAMARASTYGEVTDMLTTANDEICVIVQCETQTSVANIDAIAAVEGVDAVFVGPGDLSADMGVPGQTAHPDVEATIRHAFDRINAAGKAVGIISFSPDKVREYVDWGARFVAVGGDVAILAKGIRDAAALAGEIREG